MSAASRWSAKLTRLLEPCRYWEKEQKKKFVPILEYCTKLEKRVKELEQELRDFRQQDLLTPPEDKYKGRSSTLPEQEQFKYSLEEHCAMMLRDHGLDSERTQSFIARKNLTTSQFLDLAQGRKLDGEQHLSINS